MKPVFLLVPEPQRWGCIQNVLSSLALESSHPAGKSFCWERWMGHFPEAESKYLAPELEILERPLIV